MAHEEGINIQAIEWPEGRRMNVQQVGEAYASILLQL